MCASLTRRLAGKLRLCKRNIYRKSRRKTTADPEGLTATFDVSGTIAETIKNVAAVPSGIKLYIAKDASGALENAPANSIKPGIA